MDIDSLKRRLAGTPFSMQHALNEIKNHDQQLSLSDGLQLLEPILMQKLLKSDEDVLDDALDYIYRLLSEHQSESLWSKLSDPSHLFYKSETEKDTAILLQVRQKIATYLVLKNQSEPISFIGLIDLLPVIKLQQEAESTKYFIEKSLIYSKIQKDNQNDPSLRKCSKKQIFDFCFALNQLVSPDQTHDVQTIELNLALALILTPVLECKTTGTSLLSMRVLNPTSAEELTKWCDNVNIFDLFFSKCIHSELIKRSSYLLEYLHRNNRLGEKELEQMWHVATKKHEAFRITVLKSLTLLVVKSLRQPELRFLLEKLRLMNYKDHSRNSLELLKAILNKLAPPQVRGLQLQIEKPQHIYKPDKMQSRPRSMSDSQTQIDTYKPKLNRQQSDQRMPLFAQQLEGNLIANNPFDVPFEKQDKNTADDELSQKSEPRNAFNNEGAPQINSNNQIYWDAKPPEESKLIIDFEPVIPNQLFRNCETNIKDTEQSQLAFEGLQILWKLVQDDSVIGNQLPLVGQARSNLSVQCHTIAIDILCEVLCSVYTESWFYFLRMAIDNLRQNQFVITMQIVIQKLITAIQLPLSGQNMPKNRTELLQVLEREFKLTQCCLSSMIDFKRKCIDLIYTQNNFGHQEDDNLETQSSLDGDEFKPEPTEQNEERRSSNATHHKEEEKEETKDQIQHREIRQPTGDRSFLDSLVTNKLHNYTYYKEIFERQSFLKFLVVQCPEFMLSRKILELLWEILVQDAFYEKERDLFFIWSQDLLKALQLKQTHAQLKSSFMEAENAFADDCLELIYFETLLKLDPSTFTVAMFNCFKEFFLHTNAQYGQIEMLALGNFKAYTHNLIGIEALWSIVLSAVDETTYKISLEFFIRLFKRLEINDEIKIYILDICMSHIKSGLDITEENAQLITRTIHVLDCFISDFELNQHNKTPKQTQNFKITVHNQVQNSQGPTKIEVLLPSNTSVAALLDQLANSIFPRRISRELCLTYKGKDLKEMLKTLKDVCQTQPAVMFLTSKSEIELEYEQIQGAKQNSQVNEEELAEAVVNLKEFLGGCEVSDQVVALALKKCNLDLGDAIGMLTSEDVIADLQAELLIEEMDAPQQKAYETEELQVHKILSNQTEYFNLLFDLLNLGQAKITQAVWRLLSKISVNLTLLNSLRSLDDIDKISESEFFGWSNLVDSCHIYKMLYSLQLIQALTGAGQFAKKVSIPFEYDPAWQLKFIDKGGLAHLFQLLITSVIDRTEIAVIQPVLTKRKSRRRAAIQRQNDLKIQKNDQAQCMSLLVNLIQVYVSAALLSFNKQPNIQQLVQNSITSPFRRKKDQSSQKLEEKLASEFVEVKSENTSTEKASQDTPKFNNSSVGEKSPLLQDQQTTNKQDQNFSDNFPKLIQKISEETATKILFSIVNLPELTSRLLLLSHMALITEQDCNVQEHQGDLVLHCIDTIVPLVVWQHDLETQILAFEYLPQLLKNAMKCQNSSVRQSVERFFRVTSQNFPAVATFVLTTLLSQLPQSQIYFEEYFKLLASVSLMQPKQFVFSKDEIQRVKTDQESFIDEKFVSQTILATLVDLIKQNVKNEPLLCGIFQFFWAMLELQPKLKDVCRLEYDLISRLFTLMFTIENHSKLIKQVENAPFTMKQTRKRCMDLLKSLTSHNQSNFEQLMDFLQGFQSKVSRILKNHAISDYFANQGQTRSKVGYVGLKNFGCTCYMNSLIQQLYMIKELSLPIVNFDELVTDDVFMEFQKIFSNLKESQKISYAPLGFTQCFQFVRGEQVNVRQMQDTHEFFNILIDNIENCHPSLKKLLQTTIGGTLINEIKSLESDYTYQSKREELFYCLSLDIKNKKTLQEALDMFVKPDVLEGENKYYCEKYETHIDASRRNYIKDIQNTLIINLKRFEFDFNLLQHVKINDFMEFPQELDLRPWTEVDLCDDSSVQEGDSDMEEHQVVGRYSDHEAISEETPIVCDSSGQDVKSDSGFEDLIGDNQGSNKPKKKQKFKNNALSDNQYLYELVGVLVHSGSANSGHYYSYIKERDGQGRWLEFNDTKVTEFDIGQLAEKCFGNKKEQQSDWQMQMGHSNAYLLFYQKVNSHSDAQKSIQINAVSETLQEPSSLSTRSRKILQEIWNENDAFLHLNLFLDFDYFKFIWELLSSSKHIAKSLAGSGSDAFATMCQKFGTRFAFDILTQVKETNVFVQWMPLLDQMFQETPSGCTWFLGYLHKHDLCKQLLQHANGEVREQFGTLFKTAYLAEQTHLRQAQQRQLFASTQLSTGDQKSTECLNQLLDLLEASSKQPAQNQQDYFDVINSIVLKGGFGVTLQLLEQNFVTRLIDIIKTKDVSSEPALIVRPLDLLKLITVTQGMTQKHLYDPNSRFQKEEEDEYLSPDQESKLLDPAFVTTVIVACFDSPKEISKDIQDALLAIMVHLSWGNEDNLKTCLNYINECPKKNEESSSMLSKMAKKLEASARGEAVISDDEINIDIDAQINNLDTSFGQEFQ